MPLPNILQQILDDKRVELAAARSAVPEAELRAAADGCPPARDFAGALAAVAGVALIAEVKKASPSAGLIRDDFEAVTIASTYAANGATCISVLTDSKYFQGSPEFLRDIRAAVDRPLLRKDFVVEAYQVAEARAWGADAALLIVAALSPAELQDLMGEAAALGLTALVEVHTAEETDVAVASGAKLIGINNRDLTIFETRLETTAKLRPLIPDDRLVVSESGIRTPADVAWLHDVPVDAMLVGEALMREADYGAKTRALAEAGRRAGQLRPPRIPLRSSPPRCSRSPRPTPRSLTSG